MKRIVLLVSALFLSAAFVDAAIIDSVKGKVTVFKKSTKKEVKAMVGMYLSPLDQIRTATGAEARIQLDNGRRMSIAGNQKVTVSSLSPKKKKTSGLFGNLFSSLKHKFVKGDGSKRTSAVVGVRGSNVSEQEVSSLVKATELYWAE